MRSCGQHRNHEIGADGRIRSRPARNGPSRRNVRPRDVEAAHDVPRFGEVARHRAAHIAQTDECDSRHFVMLLFDQSMKVSSSPSARGAK
jgi:hypothetical protein